MCSSTIAAGISVVEKKWAGLLERHDLERVTGYRYTTVMLRFVSV